MRPILTLAAGAALCALPVAAQAAEKAMSVATFLAKTKALQAQGMLAMTSPDLALLRDEIKTAAAAYRARVEADKAAGKPPRGCPPPAGQAKLDGKMLTADFEAIPPAKRRVSVQAAFFAFMDRKYPCAR